MNALNLVPKTNHVMLTTAIIRTPFILLFTINNGKISHFSSFLKYALGGSRAQHIRAAKEPGLQSSNAFNFISGESNDNRSTVTISRSNRALRASLVVKRTGYSSKGCRFNSQHPPGG